MASPIRCETFEDASTHHPGSRFQVSLVDSTPSEGASAFTVHVNVDRDTFFAPDRACDVHNSCMRALADTIGGHLTDDLQQWIHEKHRNSHPVEQTLTGDCCDSHRSVLDTQLGKIVDRYAKKHDPSRGSKVKSIFSKSTNRSWMSMEQSDKSRARNASKQRDGSKPESEDTIPTSAVSCVYASEVLGKTICRPPSSFAPQRPSSACFE